MSQLICILQGITDQPLRNLGGFTPLQKAKHPTLDTIATEGTVLSIEPPSTILQLETSLLALFGIDDNEYVPVGPLEAYSVGHTLAPKQVAFSLRFISIGEETVIDVADGILGDEEGRLLCQQLNDVWQDDSIHLIHLYGPRAVLITSNPAVVSMCKHQTTHPIQAIGKKWYDILPGGADQQEVRQLFQKAIKVLANNEVNALREELEETLVNGLWIGNGGERPKWSFPGRRNDYSRWCLYTAWPSIRGLAKALGFELLQLPDEAVRFGHVSMLLDKLPSLLEDVDTLVIDIPYLWQSTYKGALLEKIKTIEWLDHHWLQPVLDIVRTGGHEMLVLPLSHSDIRTGQAVKGAIPVIKWECGTEAQKALEPFSEVTICGLPKKLMVELLGDMCIA